MAARACRGQEGQAKDADYFDHGINCNSNVARPWDKPEHLHPTNYVVTQSIDFLRRRDPRKPFFLFASFHRPHPPYDPPAWAFEQYVNAAMPDPPIGDWAATFDPWENGTRPDCSRGKVPPDVLRRARAGYYGHCTHIDHQINRFLESLQEFRVHENTYVCFVSDHGELLGDHHLWRKQMPYEGSTRIPFMLKGPKGCGIQTGSQPGHVAELRDVMPTLLDCAGLPIPACVEGRSVLPLARGKTLRWREYLHGEHAWIPFGGTAHWVTDGKEKYVWLSARGHEQLFDLTNDPQELHNLAGDKRNAGRQAHWRGVLIKELTGREEGYSNGQRLIAGCQPRAVLSTPPATRAQKRRTVRYG